MGRRVTVRTSPSLALIKYWGKKEGGGNIPATSSLAVSLNSLQTESRIKFGKRDSVTLNGETQNPDRYLPFFDRARELLKIHVHFCCVSENNFPTAAGLASSSSGFSALALGVNALTGGGLSPEVLSSLAGVGSASAARAVYGGFTLLPEGAESAVPLHKNTFWPDFRVIVVSLSSKKKTVSSRDGMNRSKETSPFYSSWVKDSEKLFKGGLDALERRDLPTLGPFIRMSYLRMFSTMFSSDPPLIYWQPVSLGIIHLCARLREEGVGAWETMDAGPQVKIFCLKGDAGFIIRRVGEEFPECSFLADRPGPGPVILEDE